MIFFQRKKGFVKLRNNFRKKRKLSKYFFRKFESVNLNKESLAISKE